MSLQHILAPMLVVIVSQQWGRETTRSAELICVPFTENDLSKTNCRQVKPGGAQVSGRCFVLQSAQMIDARLQ